MLIATATATALLALPAAALANHGSGDGPVSSLTSLPTTSDNPLRDGKYLPMQAFTVVGAPASAVEPAYTSPGSRLRAGEGSGGATDTPAYSSPGSRLRAGEGSGGATNSQSPTTTAAQTPIQIVHVVKPGGFDFRDAGIGAALGALLVAALSSALILTLRNRSSALAAGSGAS
jgi:hypothetical protein